MSKDGLTSKDFVSLTLNKYEALVLFDWLIEFDESEAGPGLDSAERKVLWTLEALLEPRLVEILAPNYRELLDVARKRVVDQGIPRENQ